MRITDNHGESLCFSTFNLIVLLTVVLAFELLLFFDSFHRLLGIDYSLTEALLSVGIKSTIVRVPLGLSVLFD